MKYPKGGTSGLSLGAMVREGPPSLPARTKAGPKDAINRTIRRTVIDLDAMRGLTSVPILFMDYKPMSPMRVDNPYVIVRKTVLSRSSIGPPMALAFLVDFDGTISVTDASYELLDRFGDKGWQDIEKEALEGRTSIKQALARQASMVRVAYDEAALYLTEKVQLREGFSEFAAWCRESGVHIEICSDGFGSTIEVLLAHWGLDWIPWTSNRTELMADGMLIEFPYWKEGCPVNGNCKCSQLDRLKGTFDDVIFVGDGTTDLCVARKADYVLARDRLHNILSTEGKEHIRWFEWDDVRAAGERSLAAFPGRERRGVR